MRELVSPTPGRGAGHRGAQRGQLPLLPTHWMRRERLEQRLTAAAHPLTVVTGPAGSGKTMLVAGWARCSDIGPCCWVSLRAAGGDRLAAARTWLSGATDLGSTSGRRRSGLLVVDGIEVLSEHPSTDHLRDVLLTVPDGVRVILIGRHANALPAGDTERPSWTELTGGELAFTVEEAVELFRAHGLEVTSGMARAAVERNEGWAAGLRLASLRNVARAQGAVVDPVSDIRSLTGYFEREVLGREPAGVRSFLEQVSVLPRVTAEVAEAVTGRTGAADLLERLAQEAVFVRPSGDGGHVLHRLFAEVLTHELSLRGAAAVASSRRRAVTAYEETGEDDAAAGVLVASRDYDRAYDIRLRALRRQLEWQIGRVGAAHLPGGIPDWYLCADPWRIYATCVAQLAAEALEDAAMWLVRLEVASAGRGAPPALRERAHRLRALHAMMLVDPDSALEHLTLADQLDGPAVDAGADPGRRGIEGVDDDIHAMVRAVAVRAHAALGRPAAAREALGGLAGEGVTPLGMAGPGALAALALAEGRLRDALELSRSVLAVPGEAGDEARVVSLECHVVAARALYERNELPEAGIELESAGLRCTGAGQRRWAAVVRCEQARIATAQRRFDDALRLLDEARRPEVCGAASPLVDRLIDDAEIRCRLAMGDVTTGRRLFSAGPPALRSPELTARLALAAGRPDAAMAACEVGGEDVTRRVAIERAVLRARSLSVVGNREAAELVIRGAIDLARAERFSRVFLDEPAQGGELLRALARSGPDSFLDALAGQQPRTVQTTLVVLEPLTLRERELLAFLPSHLSQHQIAREMYISANTVKTHMKGLYRKLGATSRSEAVDAARTCGLL